MKINSAIILCFFFLLAAPMHSYAGFVVKRQTFVADSTPVSAPNSGRTIVSREHISALKTIKNLAIPGEDNYKATRKKDSSGWEGIVALCCGVTGFVTFGILSVAAIIFGAIGIQKHKKNKGLATAGLVLGIIGVVFFVFAVAFLIAVFG